MQWNMLDKEGRQVSTDTLDGIESMDTTEYQAVDNTCAGRAKWGGEDPQPWDMMPEAQRNDSHAAELTPKRESEEGTDVHIEAASTQPDKGHPPTTAPGSPKRNKKLKTDRNREQLQERTRSLTHKAANKGKLWANHATAYDTPLMYRMYIVKIASLNINGIRSQTQVGIMMDFLRKQDIDIVLVQEITDWRAWFYTVMPHTST